MRNQREEYYDAAAKVRITVADVTDAAQRLAAGHLCGPTSAHYLAEHLAAVALLGAETSAPDETVVLQMKCAGPLGGLCVECTAQGTLRGYTERKTLDDFDGLGAPDARRVVGERQYQVTRSVPGRVLSQGVAATLDAYLAQSLQRRAAMRVEAAVSDSVEILTARGVLVEVLPDAGEKEEDFSINRLIDSSIFSRVERAELEDSLHVSSRSTRLNPTNASMQSKNRKIEKSKNLDDSSFFIPHSSLSVSVRNLLKKLGYPNAELKKTTPLSFACRCSPERAAAMLAALSPEEHATLPPSLDITCHMCGRTFTVRS